MKWLEGKKTYIAAVALVAIGVAGYMFNALPAATATILIATGLGFFGVGSKVERYSQLILSSVDEVKKIQADLKAGNRAQAISDAREAATEVGVAVAAGALSSGGGSSSAK